MTPDFANAVDPVFSYVLGLLDRIGRGEARPAEQERLSIRTLLDQGEARVGRRPEWELAQYALVSWIDEVLLEAPWDGRDWWGNNVLEVELFNTRLCSEQFFLKAHEASRLTERDALEVFYVCVVLGFRGLYRDTGTALERANALRLPPDLETWAKQTALAIRLGQDRAPLVDAGIVGESAAPLQGQLLLLWSSLGALALLAIVAVVWLTRPG
jgi:type VI secretion system protein ImpK